MKAVVRTAPGVLELNYVWLPTWIGMNAALKKEIEDELKSKLEGQPLDEDAAHDLVIQFILNKFVYIRGLEAYLDGLKYVEYV